MATVYDSFIGNTVDKIEYVSGALDTALYPNSNNVAIFGPVYLPRIYGKDLTAFEIASSGKIAITLNDVHSFDISKASYIENTSNNIINSYSNSLELKGNEGDIDIFMDAYSNEIRISAASNVRINANNGDFVAAATSNISIMASNTLMLNSSASNISMYAASNVEITTNNNLVIMAQSNASVTTTSGSVSVLSYSNIVSEAQNGFVSISADSNIMSLYAYSNMSFATSNVLDVYANSNLTLTTSNNLVTIAQSNASVTTTSGSVSVLSYSNIVSEAQNGFVSISADSNIMSLYAYSNMSFATSNVLNMYANSNLTLTTSNNLVTVAQSNVTINATSGSVTISSLSNITLNNSNAFNINSVQTVGITSSNINVNSKQNVNVTASNNVLVSGSNDVTVSAKNSLTLSATALNMEISGNQSFTATEKIDFFISSSPLTPEIPVFSVSGNLISVNGDLLITGTVNTSNIINTTVIQQDLKIQDKKILLSAPLGGAAEQDVPIDGFATNDKSGVEIMGAPTGADVSHSNIYQKAVLWNYGVNGINDLGTANVQSEAYWEMLGGAFHLTNRSLIEGDERDTSFIFRVNEDDELEIQKKYWDSNNWDYSYKRLARFGRVL